MNILSGRSELDTFKILKDGLPTVEPHLSAIVEARQKVTIVVQSKTQARVNRPAPRHFNGGGISMRKVWMCALLFLGMAMFAAATPLQAEEGGGGASHNYTKFHGKVTALDAANASLTLTNKDGATQTFTIPAGAKISVNGAESTLAAAAVGMYGAVKMDNGTIIMVKLHTPGAKKDKPKA